MTGPPAGTRTDDDTGTLAELLRQPGERGLRAALLILLTFTAGWTDAIAYVELGHVFASFMSGNLLFLGLSAIHGERAILLRTTVALVCFIGGAFLGELLLGKGPAHRTRAVWLGTLATYLARDALALTGFAVASVLMDPATHPAHQIALLALAAFAMGPVGIMVGALEVPGVVANALTGTLLQLAKRFAENFAGRKPTHPLTMQTLSALCVTYVLAAVIVTLCRTWAGRLFVPAAVLTILVLVLLGARRTGMAPRVRE